MLIFTSYGLEVITKTIDEVKDLREALETAGNDTDIILDPSKMYEWRSDDPIRVKSERVRLIGFGPPSGNKDFNPKSEKNKRAIIKSHDELTFEGAKQLQIIGCVFELKLRMKECNDCTVAYSDFHYDPANVETHIFVLTNGSRNRIYSCEFHDKENNGVFLIIKDEKENDGQIEKKTFDNVVERCVFRDHRYGKDGGESVVLGNSNQKSHDLRTVIIRCYFKDLKGDPEDISIKSCGNRVENCLHENCESNFVMRHGYNNTIEGCIFQGSGGIRVYGRGNEITDNFFLNNDSQKYRPITLGSGKIDNNDEASYTQVWKNKITGNWFVNCNVCVLWGREGDGPSPPEGCNFENNTIIAEKVNTAVLEFSDGGRVKGKARETDKDEWDNRFNNNVVYGEAKYFVEDDNKEKRNISLEDKEKELLKSSYKETNEMPKFEVPDLLGEKTGQLTFEWPLRTRT